MKGYTTRGPLIVGSDVNGECHLVRIENSVSCNFNKQLQELDLPMEISVKNLLSAQPLGLECLGAIEIEQVNNSDWSDAKLIDEDVKSDLPTKDIDNITCLEDADKPNFQDDRRNILVEIIDQRLNKTSGKNNILTFNVKSSTNISVPITCYNYPYNDIMDIEQNASAIFINVLEIKKEGTLTYKFDNSSAVIPSWCESLNNDIVDRWLQSENTKCKYTGKNCMLIIFI